MDRRSSLDPWLLAILGVSLVVKLAVLAFAASADPSRFVEYDFRSYEKPALSLLEHGRFSVSPEQPDLPETIRTPGYPAFIALIYAIAGESIAAIVAAQILVSLGTTVVVYGAARHLFGEVAARGAAIVVSLDVASFARTFVVTTETLFALVLSVAVYCAVRVLGRAEGNVTLWSLGFGIASGAAVFVRPIAYYFIPLAAVMVLAGGWKRGSGAKAVARMLAAFLLPPMLMIGGWQARNERLTGVSAFSQIEGINMLFFRGAGAKALEEGKGLGRVVRGLTGMSFDDAWKLASSHPERGLSEQWKREGLQLLVKHPVGAARMTAGGAAQLLAGPGDRQLAKILGIETNASAPREDLVDVSPAQFIKEMSGSPLQSAMFLAAVVWLVAMFAGVATGAVSSLRGGEDLFVHLFLLATFAYFVLASAGPEANSRFRASFTPILAIYAGAGLQALRVRR